MILIQRDAYRNGAMKLKCTLMESRQDMMTLMNAFAMDYWELLFDFDLEWNALLSSLRNFCYETVIPNLF